MTQSLELLLDEETETDVRNQWQVLAAAGLPSMARHTSDSNRPHITVAVAQNAFPDKAERAFGDLPTLLPISLTLGSHLLFGTGTTRVLCRLIVMNQRLLDLHALVAGHLNDLAPQYLRPGRWTPHVTLALRLPLADVPYALDVLGDVDEHAGEAVAVRRWDSDARRTWSLG